MNDEEEPFGTTSLPYGPGLVHVQYDVSSGSSPNNNMQQPVQQQIATYDSTKQDMCLYGSTLIAVNTHFVCYVVKNGLIRILHRNSTLRTLLRSHQNQIITDIQFFQDGDVLATIGHDNTSSKVVIWRVFERSPEIISEQLLEIASTNKIQIVRVIWHPFNPNQFWMIYNDLTTTPKPTTTIACLVETTRITTSIHPIHNYAVADFITDAVLQEGGIVLLKNNNNNSITTSSSTNIVPNLTDLIWNDTRYMIATYDNGDIDLIDLKQTTIQSYGNTMVTVPTIIQTVTNNTSPVYRCLLLPHENTIISNNTTNNKVTSCFVTGSNNNQILTLWTPFTLDGPPPKPYQIIELKNNNQNNDENEEKSYILNVCFGPAPATAAPPSCFIIASCREYNNNNNNTSCLYAFHVKASWSTKQHEQQNRQSALLVGCDYVVPFRIDHPIYSCTVMCAPTTDITEDELNEQGGLIFDMKLFTYQKTSIQCITLTSYMCLPPKHTYTEPTRGVTVIQLSQNQNQEQDNDNNDITEEQVDNIVSHNGDKSNTIAMQFEEYDVDDDDDDDDEENDNDNIDDDDVEAPDASTLPNPNGTDSNAFANWLGAIATTTSSNKPTEAIPPPPPPPPPATILPSPPPPQEVTPPPHPPQSFLSPQQILADNIIINQQQQQQQQSAPPVQQEEAVKPTSVRSTSAEKKKEKVAVKTNSRQATPTTGNTTQEVSKRAGKKKNKGKGSESTTATPTPTGPITILQRSNSNDDNKKLSVAPPPPVAGGGVPTPPPQSAAPTVDVTEDVRRVLREEMRMTVMPGLEKAVGKITIPSVSDALQPLHSTINDLNKQGIQIDYDKIVSAITAAIDAPIRAAFTESMKTILIPTIESITNQIFQQVSNHLENNFDNNTNNNNDNNNSNLESISKQLSTMTALVAELTNEVQSLRTSVANQSAAANAGPGQHHQHHHHQQRPPSPPTIDPIEAQRNLIINLLSTHKYEEAFTKAVSNPTVDMTLFCCRNADINAVFGTAGGTNLSQPILLCLMQQLGTVLVIPNNVINDNDVQMSLEWLQEIALSINHIDPSIQRHVPHVVQQVINNISQRMQQQNSNNDNPMLRRQLQRIFQIVRGMQMS